MGECQVILSAIQLKLSGNQKKRMLVVQPQADDSATLAAHQEPRKA